MTNFEKYKDYLKKIKGHFESDKTKRLYQEYEPLSDSDLDLIENICRIANKKYKYIIKTEGGVYNLFVDKPTILENAFGRYCSSNSVYLSILDPDKKLFQNIQYKDGLYDIENKTFIK